MNRTTAQKSAAVRGRKVSKPPAVPHVETLPCGDGLHVLTNRMERGNAVTFCVGCLATWSALDAEARR